MSTKVVAISGHEMAWQAGTGMLQSELRDGPPVTIQFVEYNGPPIHRMSPVDMEFDKMSFVVGDSAGIRSHYVEPASGMADVATGRLNSEISPPELRAMCIANGNDSSRMTEHTVEMDDGRKRPLKPGTKSQ